MNKTIFLLLACCMTSLQTFAQDASKWFSKGLEALEKDQYEEAIRCFDKCIGAEASNLNAWYNRGLAKAWSKKYDEAIADFDHVIRLKPDFAAAYNSRGTMRQNLTDYDGAMDDFNEAVSLKKDFALALNNRGRLHQLLGDKELACKDFSRAMELGNEHARRKVEQCNDTTQTRSFSILYLRKVSGDKNYGFSPDNPVRVGPGPDGGPANEHTYLKLLRDAQGQPVEYTRLGSCCGYESEYGFMGVALLDRYEITYLDPKGRKTKKTVYISMYDYEEPMILDGFGTVKTK